MQAVVFHEHGGPEVLRMEDIPQPTPGPGEVLLRAHSNGFSGRECSHSSKAA